MEMNKTYSVIVSKRATQMLVSHAAFLAKVSPEAANRLVASFEETANSLATMPERCSWLIADYIPPNKYRKILFDSFPDHRQYGVCRLCGGLQTGLWLVAQIKE